MLGKAAFQYYNKAKSQKEHGNNIMFEVHKPFEFILFIKMYPLCSTGNLINYLEKRKTL
jgi:hypothetical protein